MEHWHHHSHDRGNQHHPNSLPSMEGLEYLTRPVIAKKLVRDVLTISVGKRRMPWVEVEHKGSVAYQLLQAALLAVGWHMQRYIGRYYVLYRKMMSTRHSVL